MYIDDPPTGAGGMFLAARVKTGGCWIMYSDGVYFWLFANNNTAMLTGNFSKCAYLVQQALECNIFRNSHVCLRLESRHGIILKFNRSLESSSPYCYHF